jgi:2-dehydropantoate 2-reductase
MRILVLGAGAVGGYFFGRLIEKYGSVSTGEGDDDGDDSNNQKRIIIVNFLVRSGRATQLKSDGLLLQNPDGTITIIRNIETIVSGRDGKSEEEDPSQPLPKFDIIVLACKAYGLLGALDAIAKYVQPGVVILPLLNGMAHMDTIFGRFPTATVLGGACGIVAALDSSTGVIQRMNASQWITAGVWSNPDFTKEETDATAKVSQLMQSLKTAGLDAHVSDNIEQAMWNKWTLLTTIAAATCLMSANIGEICSTSHGAAFLKRLYEEVRSIAMAAGSCPSSNAEDEQMFQNVFSDRNSIIKASMCRDMESGSQTEAEHVIGDLLRRRDSRQADSGVIIDAPLLSAAYTGLQVYEARRRTGGDNNNNNNN